MAAKHDMALTGAELIAAERQRQITKERWTAAHDDAHDDESLLLAAICYAAPERIFVRKDYAVSVEFCDPWPESWAERWDKRGVYGNAFEAGNGIADPETYTEEQRLDLLVKAGALIAAEIDRRKRAPGVPAREEALRVAGAAGPLGDPDVLAAGVTPCDDLGFKRRNAATTIGLWLYQVQCANPEDTETFKAVLRDVQKLLTSDGVGGNDGR